MIDALWDLWPFLMLLLVAVVLSRFDVELANLYRSKAPSSPAPPAPVKHPDTEECRMAVHEAGHAVAAWWCTCVTTINHVTIEAPDGGNVSYKTRYGSEQATWCLLVIGLAGIAGELGMYTRWRAASAWMDLAKAKIGAMRLAEVAALTDRPLRPPWGELSGPVLPFASMFSDAPSGAAVYVLEQAYLKARDLLRRRRLQHEQLACMLMAHRSVDERTVEKLFGHRVFVRTFGFMGGSRFIDGGVP